MSLLLYLIIRVRTKVAYASFYFYKYLQLKKWDPRRNLFTFSEEVFRPFEERRDREEARQRES